MQQFDTPTPVSAVLDIPAGRIRVIAADRADTTVEVLPSDASKARDVKAVEQITVDYRDGVARIEALPAKNRMLGNAGSVEVTIHLPAGSRIEATAVSAELRGVGRLGDVVFEGAQASVDLDEAASVRITVAAGDIAIGRLEGPAEISTQKGDIDIAQAVSGALVLRTEMGDVSVVAADGVSASLDAGTTHGRIHNALRNTDGSAAALTIRATTANGDIVARSL